MKNFNPPGIVADHKGSVSAPIRVLVVDDHPAVVDALTVLIEFQPDMEVCAQAHTFEEALTLVAECKPDVAITDILLGDGHGLDLLSQIHARFPEVRLIVFSMCQETAFAERAIRVGAFGYVMKTQPTQSVIEAIRTVWKGDVYVSRKIASRMLNKIIERENAANMFPLETLTDNELLVFEMLGHAYSLRDVARCLGISRKTATAYQRHAQKKLGAENPARLVQQAYSWVNGLQPVRRTDDEAPAFVSRALPQNGRKMMPAFQHRSQ